LIVVSGRLHNGKRPWTDVVVGVGEQLLGAVQVANPSVRLVAEQAGIAEASAGVVRGNPETVLVAAGVLVVAVDDLGLKVVLGRKGGSSFRNGRGG
jgi:hypothetical protein